VPLTNSSQGLGPKTIAQRLTDEGIPSPSGHDPARNRHRAKAKGAWSTSAGSPTPAEYARSEVLEAEHPRDAYLREDQVIGHVYRWLAQLFDPEMSCRRGDLHPNPTRASAR
jgi:hypothetical protein